MPTHTPAGVLVMSYGFCLLFVEKERREVFGGLILGGMVQLLLDACKNHLGTGVIPVAWPFSWESYGFGLFQPENGIYLTPPALLLLYWGRTLSSVPIHSPSRDLGTNT